MDIFSWIVFNFYTIYISPAEIKLKRAGVVEPGQIN
jgi:hypothetical protein